MTVSKSTLNRRLYRRTVPTFLASALIIVLLVEYFGAEYQPLIIFRGQITKYVSIATAFVMLYAYLTLIRWNSKVILKRTMDKRFFASAIFGVSVVFFVILAAVIGTGSYMFRTLYTYLVTYVASGLMLHYVHYIYETYANFPTLTSKDNILFFIGFIFTIIKEIPLMAASIPTLVPIGLWFENVPTIAFSRAIFITMAVSAVILCVRTMVGKEPGVIEIEAIE